MSPPVMSIAVCPDADMHRLGLTAKAEHHTPVEVTVSVIPPYSDGDVRVMHNGTVRCVETDPATADERFRPCVCASFAQQ